MRSALLTPPVVLAGVLLLAACGSQRAGSGSDGSAQTRVSGAPDSPNGSSCRARPSGTPAASSPPAPPGGPSGLEEDGVRITGLSGGARPCAAFEVTHHQGEPFTYTITFTFLSATGEALATAERTVPSVRPRRTVQRTVTVDGLPPGAHGAAHVRITQVRSVPADEASSAGGPCPPSGTRVYADDGDAAMGLRVVGLHLENCGTGTVRLNGYPRLQLLDGDHKPVSGVRVLRGGSAIATGTGADGMPHPLALKPGERAYAGLVWRNTVDSVVGDPVNAPYTRVWARPGAAPVMVVPEFDLGTTGRLGVGPWKKDGTDTPATGGTPGMRPSGPPSAPTVPAHP